MKPRVLIIDDESEIRELFRSFLEDEGYDIMEAVNGQEAFNMAANEKFDIYITDVFMPEMNGVEFMKVLKMLDPDAVVIIVTGYDNMECTRQALDYGAFRFLTKPVKMADFRNIVRLGLTERRKLFHTSTAEKLQRIKEKINTNVELREKLFKKLQAFLLNVEKLQPTYVEIGGPGTEGKVWGKFYSSFRPISLDYSFSQDEINIMILSIIANSQLDTLIKEKSVKTHFEFINNNVKYRYRLNFYFEMDELVIGIKTTRRDLISLEQMNFDRNVLKHFTFKNENSGLVIVSGPPGSGKSCLIDTIINANNQHLSGNIYIISDSIEFYHESKNCVIRHQELLRDVNSTEEALQQCLEYHPNCVSLGDINSPEILDNVLRLVDTGCLVFATLRNKSVVETIYKLLSYYPSTSHDLVRRNLARCLSAIVCLHLAPTLDDKMVSIKEVMIKNDQLTQAIAYGSIDEIYEILQRSKKDGMYTLEQDIVRAVNQKLISVDTATEMTTKINLLKDMLKYNKD